ncbi:tetraacyldisaccharide 4'-kinase [Kingella negevensis]|uniref:tetraacyldisaccharide 4'-kinase n=1 Tax=Kingella negevensis TaxID=1522312 RepID=UPI00255148AF|nr:tetraacyldisaccharide 4'-kinase [Kingella negevensis]MDK4685615.1 tetraacyldisaccharide 4'-kinase [Kingella negevensis]MDK4708046.1 tetraacyldisaccharide 4'-kinase [Kingella negevensis]MDK4709610.1 tetraacyldisaccharide 4'-kinase [Kingella negevensis]
MKSLHQIIENHWQNPNPILRLFLCPLSKLFAHIAAKRRANFLSGSLKTQKLPVPVVIVGNIHAGGTGKTPITTALVSSLQKRGVKVGVISRGYGRASQAIHVLTDNSRAADAGDEPLMLFRQTHVPTAVGANRYEVGRALLAQNPDLQMIVADDGLQHYRLARDVEICVFPAADMGRDNLDVLPNGGLREPVSRLETVDCVVFSNGTTEQKTVFRLPENVFYSQTQIAAPYRFNCPQETLLASSLKTGETCVAVAGIARPQRFFDSLGKLGFRLQNTVALPDHAAINVADLPVADYVFITEKDAAKLPENVPENVWVLPIRAEIEPDLGDWVLWKLGI